MKRTLRQPCNDCPFRRVSTPGWLGAGDPDYFISAALADEFGGDRCEGNVAEPCHKTIDYSDGWQDRLGDEAEVCVGALIFYRNVNAYKLPRQPERSDLVRGVKPDHETVFSTAEEFADHHEGSWFKSWEAARRG